MPSFNPIEYFGKKEKERERDEMHVGGMDGVGEGEEVKGEM